MAPPATTTAVRSHGNTVISTFLQQLFTKTSAKKFLGVYLLWILVKYRRTALGTRPRSDLKGPRGLPLIGNFWGAATLHREKFLQNQVDNFAKYGPVWAITVPFIGRVITFKDPAVIDHILRTNFWSYEKGPRFKEGLFPLVGEGIFSADGQHWKWQRKTASHIFSVKTFRAYTSDVFCREMELVIKYLDTIADTGMQVDAQDVFYSFTLDSFGEIAFGKSFGCLDDPEKEVPFAKAFDRLNHGVAGRFNNPMWKLKDWWTGNDVQVKKDSKFLHDAALEMIEQRRKENQLNPETQLKRDLLQLFLDVTDDDGKPLSDDMLIDSILSFIVAGRDTTAQALSWTFYLMHRAGSDPNIAANLRKEADDVLQGGFPTYESTKKQRYAEACFYEALRLYPVVPKNIKTCVEDDVLPGGIRVYKGERIGWSNYAMGRETSLWGPDAEVYRPERWLNGEKPSSSKFAAFHHGPRTCLGQQFATIEAITLMSMLAQKFTFELVDPSMAPDYAPSLTLPMKRGLPIRVSRRKDI